MSTRKTLPKTVINRLNRLKERRGLTLEELAERLGFSRAKVQRILGGAIRTIDVEDLRTVRCFLEGRASEAVLLAKVPAGAQRVLVWDEKRKEAWRDIGREGPGAIRPSDEIIIDDSGNPRVMMGRPGRRKKAAWVEDGLDRTVAMTVLKHVVVKSDTLEQFKKKLSKTRYADLATKVTVNELFDALG